ncbi:MAG: DUF167 domain-containing protein [Patescibacteria group bacterium]
MKIIVYAKPGAHENRILQLEEKIFSVAVTAPPVDGRANEAIRESIAKYFKVGLFRVHIVSGGKARIKTVEIIGI